ncbi:PsbP domain-containing protein 5 chloroplastic [Zea mays]|uniref:PsbP domain-containing protein 5 chloroplastic n=1 Tax=Zea mays TaxID=4577 RepID=A0A1D6NJM1_MAIZE|nr:PsbP domain-containing protein 5 chloroplastic [Zea mays]
MAGALLSSPHYLWSPTSQPSLRPRHALALPLTRFPTRRPFVLLCTEYPPSLTAAPDCWMVGSWVLRRSRGPLGTGAVRVLPPRRRARVLASCSREPAAMNRGLEVERRRLLMSGLVSSFTIVLPISGAYAVMETNEDVKMNTQVDEINAYSFLYPVELPGKKFSFKWDKLVTYKLLSCYSVPRVESRKPERYSSAAPLSLSIGPPNSRFLPSKDKSLWDPKDVADCILSDRSTLKVTTGQRMTESSVLDAHATEVDGEPYWYYEYLVRKSPTKSVSLYVLNDTLCFIRHQNQIWYLYSLNASTLSKQWESVRLECPIVAYHFSKEIFFCV